jgi:hypothetical protein
MPSYRPSVNNTKAKTQHLLTARSLFHHAHGRDIVTLTTVEKVEPEGAPGVHHQTAAKEPTALPTALKENVDKQYKKICGGKGAKERILYIPAAIILNELTRLWFNSEQNPPPFVIVHLANPDNPLPGDTYDTQYRPDFVSRRATIHELEEYLELLKSAARTIPNIDDLRPAHGEVVSTVEHKK